jgi:hypothetical protein
MPLRVSFPKFRSIFLPVTTTAHTPITSKRPTMSSTTTPSDIGVGVPEDAQYWHRHISPKVPPHWVYSKPIQKSQQDDREYRLIRLDNGLQAMLVHDASADKAAASLDVAVGHLHDPVRIHFLHSRPYVRSTNTADTWRSNRLTCQGSRISASISCSWCLPL